MFRITASIVLMVLVGCSDYDDDDDYNRAPTVGNIADQEISANQASGAITININDDNTATNNLGISLSSNNQNVLNDAGLDFTVSGSGQIDLTITPVTGQVGTSTVTVTVTDANALATSASFVVSVVNQQLSANDFIRSIFAVSMNADPVSIDAIDLLQDITDETAFDDLIN
jgi:acyl-CoA hydrolase